MSVKKALEEIATKAAKNVGDLDASAGSGKGAVGGAAGREAKKAGKQKKVKRLSIFDRTNTEGIFSKSGAFKEGAADAVPNAVRSLLQSPDGGPTLNDLTKKELRSLHKELIASGNENLANNLVKKTKPNNWTGPELKQAENAQPLPDDGSDVLAKSNPDPNDLNGTTRKPRKRPVSDVTVTKPDGEEVKAVDSNTFRPQDRPLPTDDLYGQYVNNRIKDTDLKAQMDALMKSPGVQAAYRADRGLDGTASIFATGRGGSLSDDYKAWILEKSNDGGTDFFDRAFASGRNNVPKRNAVPKSGIDKVTTAKERGVNSASKIAGADVGAPQGTEDFAKRVITEGSVDPAELPGATPEVSGRKQATLPTDAKRQMGVEELVQGLRDDASPEVLRIIAEGSDVESSEMAYQVVEAFLNRRIPTGDRVSEAAHRAAVQAGADALAASLNRPPYTDLHPSILDANNAATRIDAESGKKPIEGQPVEVSGSGNDVTPGSRANALDASQTAEMGNARQRNALIRKVAEEQGVEPNDINRILRSKNLIQVKGADGVMLDVPQANAESLYILASRGEDLLDWDAHAKVQQQLATGTFPTNKDGAGFADGTSLGDGTPKQAATDATVTQQPQVKAQEQFGPLGTKFDPENNLYHKYLRDGPRKIKNQKDYNNLLNTSDNVALEDEAKSVGFKNTKPRGVSKKARQALDEQNFPGDEDAAPVWEDGSLKKDAETATKALKDDPALLEPVPEDIVSPPKQAPKGKSKSKPEVRDPNVERAAKNSSQVAAAEDWLNQNGIDVEGYDDYEIMETFFDSYKAADAAPEAPKGKPKSSKKPAAEEPVGDELPEVPEAMKGETVSSLDDDRKAFTTENLRKYVEQTLVDNGMSKPDAKKFVKQMDRQQLLNEYEASSGNNGVGRVEQYPGRTPQDAGAGTSSRPTGMQEFGPSAGPSGKDNVNTKLTPFEVRSSDTGKYPDKPIPTRRDYKKGQGFDNDVKNAKVDKTVDDVEKWAVRGGTTVGLGLLAAWMVSQGMTGDDDEGKSTMQPGGSVDNPAMPQGAGAGGGGGRSSGSMGGGGGMSPLERIRAAQGDRYVAGLPSTRPVRGY